VRRVQSGPVGAGAGVLALVAALSFILRLPPHAVLVGLCCAVVGPLALHLAQRRYAVDLLGPADLVTLVRAVLGCGVLVVAVADGPAVALGGLVTVALALDWVDGRVARRTGTVSELGARLDMEVDALLILVLSWYVATEVGWWVLGLGVARYAFAGLLWLVPPLRFDPPPRPWCKTVSVLVAAVLAASAVGLLTGAAEMTCLVVVSALLAESFAHEAIDRWRAGVQVRTVTPALGGSRG